jgi:uncharacterized membrane protein YhhN
MSVRRSRLIIVLTTLAAISAAVDIAAQYFGRRTIVYIFKPLTMVFVISIAATDAADRKSGYRNLIIAGLCCSLVGDVFLMLPSDRFVPGLLSFLVAHLLYIGAFRSRTFGLSSAWPAAACASYGILMLWFLFPHLGEMKLPVSIYLIVILVMAWQAFNRWVTNTQAGSAFAALGAVLFVASDSIIAIDRFYGRVLFADLLIMATYFSAQWLIALSVVSSRP